jgi:hypothetical protein
VRAREVARGNRHQERTSEDQVEVAAVTGEDETEQLCTRDRRARHAAGDGFPLAEHEGQDEMRGQRGDRQVQALDPQAGQADDDAEPGGDETRDRQRHEERHAHLGQPGHGVAADAEEGAVAERDEPGIAGGEVQPQRCNDVDTDDAGHGQRVVAAPQRQREQRQREDQHPAAGGGRVPQALFGREGFVEDRRSHLRARPAAKGHEGAHFREPWALSAPSGGSERSERGGFIGYSLSIVRVPKMP